MAAEAAGAAAARARRGARRLRGRRRRRADVPRAPRRRAGGERPGDDRQGAHRRDLPPPEQGLRGPGLRRAPVGAAPRARRAAAGRHADRVRRRGRRRDRRQRRASADEDQELAVIGADRDAPHANGAAHFAARRKFDRRAAARQPLQARRGRARPGEVEYHERASTSCTSCGRATWSPAASARREVAPASSRRRQGGRLRDGDVVAIPADAAPVHRGLGSVPVLRREGGGEMAPPRPTAVDARPPELLPGRPDAIVDLRRAGAALVGASGATPTPGRATVFVEWPPRPARPGTSQPHLRRAPHAEARTSTTRLGARAADTHAPARRTGRVCFNWYRTAVTHPRARRRPRRRPARPSSSRSSSTTTPRSGSTASCRIALGDTGGPVVGGFNAPNRVVLTRDARPGDTLPDRRVRHQRPDLGLAAQLHLDAHGDARLLRRRARAPRGPWRSSCERLAPGLDDVVRSTRALERVAGGFEFTEGPVWSPRRRAAVLARRTRTRSTAGPARRR